MSLSSKRSLPLTLKERTTLNQIAQLPWCFIFFAVFVSESFLPDFYDFVALKQVINYEKAKEIDCANAIMLVLAFYDWL